MRKVVVNTTPLIALSHVGRLDILKELYGEIIIPEAVYRELSAKKDSICKNAVDRSRDWIRVDSIKNQMAKTIYKTQLHDGEVEVMIKARKEGYVDELKPILRQMVEEGIYISQNLIELCLKQVGEIDE